MIAEKCDQTRALNPDMVIEGGIREKKKKKKIKEVRATAENDGTVKYEHAAVQTDVKTEKVKICKEEQHLSDAGEKKKKKKKKKLKEERVEAGELVAYYNDVSVQTDVNVTKGSQEKSVRPQKKKKEFKTESDDLRENVVTVNDSECLEKSKIKKAKKKRDKEIEASITEAGEIKKKKKKDVEVTEEMDEGHNVIMSPKKKKKKRKNIEEQELKTELDDGEVKKKRKKIEEIVNDERVDKQTEKKKNTEKNASFKTQHNDESVKGNKKIKNKKKTAPVEEEMNERTVNAENKTKKKKKKKKKRLENQDEAQRECPANVNGTEEKNGDVIDEMMSSKHKKRKNIKLEVDDVTEIMEDELHDKKKSKQDKNKPMETSEVVLLSVKNGNQDEVSIDQARRLALQRDVDKESQPEPSLGQWGTAQFDSSERQAKFHRLLGGFKKSSQPITGIPGNVNMALGKDGQQTLQQGLLTEFERAQSRHLGLKNKGIGLGFTPPSNKKFAIDMNARNSIRFDD